MRVVIACVCAREKERALARAREGSRGQLWLCLGGCFVTATLVYVCVYMYIRIYQDIFEYVSIFIHVDQYIHV